jgi:hypothetical protein
MVVVVGRSKKKQQPTGKEAHKQTKQEPLKAPLDLRTRPPQLARLALKKELNHLIKTHTHTHKLVHTYPYSSMTNHHHNISRDAGEKKKKTVSIIITRQQNTTTKQNRHKHKITRERMKQKENPMRESSRSLLQLQRGCPPWMSRSAFSHPRVTCC